LAEVVNKGEAYSDYKPSAAQAQGDNSRRRKGNPDEVRGSKGAS